MVVESKGNFMRDGNCRFLRLGLRMNFKGRERQRMQRNLCHSARDSSC